MSLTWLYTLNLAQQKFIKGSVVLAYFKPENEWEEEYKYHRLNPKFSFEKNRLILESRYKNILGTLKFYSNGEKYTKEELTPQTKHEQLSLF